MATNSTKAKPVKKLVRNTEQHIARKGRSLDSLQSNIRFDVTTREAGSKTSLQSTTKYSDPELLTAKSFVRQIKTVEELPAAKHCLEEIEGKCKEVFDRRVAKRTNFHFDEKIYKDVVALNISETGATRVPKSRSSNLKCSPATRRDMEPDLQDFYLQEELLDSPIVTSSIKVKCYPSIKYNALDFYEKFKAWDKG